MSLFGIPVNTRTSPRGASSFNQRTAALKRGASALFLAFLLAAPLHAQEYGTRLGAAADGGVDYEPAGPGVLFGALDPTLQHWYIPQELYQERRWRQWEFTNYATRGYERYVNTAIEGDYFYDLYGDYVSRGWLVYDWRQDQPNALGSAVYKGSQFQSWFSSLTISGDAKGQNGYAVTVGNQIRATLTPLSFSKPTFNGVQADYVADKYAATVLASRISDPAASVTIEPSRTANSTSLVAGRGTAQIGDFVTVGATLVDARNSNTNLDLFGGNLAAGNLTEGQSKVPVTTVAVVLSDDSPADGAAGAALFNHDVRITSRDFESGEDSEWRLDQVVRPGGRWPDVFGGLARRGYLAADGAERIVLNYDFSDPDYIGPNPTTIVAVEFDYVLANDYRIELWSDRQTGRTGPPDTPLTSEIIDAQRPALLLVDRAGGNVRDITNIRRVTFDYGLPTANMIAGVTVEGTDIWGIDLYAEWDRNLRYSQFPNAALFRANEGHEISRRTADARYVTARKQRYPLFLYGEAYAIDGDYSTSAFVVDGNGDVDYGPPRSAPLRVRRGQRRSGPPSRLGAARFAGRRHRRLPGMGPEQRLHLRLQPERQQGPCATPFPTTRSPFSGMTSTGRNSSSASTSTTTPGSTASRTTPCRTSRTRRTAGGTTPSPASTWPPTPGSWRDGRRSACFPTTATTGPPTACSPWTGGSGPGGCAFSTC